jgi:hypothetical protein
MNGACKSLARYCFYIALVLFAACGSGTDAAEEEVAVEDFLEYFPEVKLPYNIADTTLLRKHSDSLAVQNAVFTRFIPDSILQKSFGKTAKPKLFPLGKAKEKGRETYLFFKAVQGNRRVGYIACFDKSNEFMTALPIVRTGYETSTQAYGGLDRKFQVTSYRERKSGDETAFKRNVYVYNDQSKDFTLILTEPNEEIIDVIINPIDTLAKRSKHSGDYIRDKKNFVSIRDGRSDSEFQFFIHFEKDKGTCNGELKGTARFVSAKTAQYKEITNPCALDFNFTTTAVVIKETAGCGAYRDIKCFFDATYPKKREPKPKKVKSKK